MSYSLKDKTAADLLLYLTLLIGAGLLLILAYISLGWSVSGNVALLNYIAFLIDRYNLVAYL